MNPNLIQKKNVISHLTIDLVSNMKPLNQRREQIYGHRKEESKMAQFEAYRNTLLPIYLLIWKEFSGFLLFVFLIYLQLCFVVA